jgi:hydroxymethyl cephem carbamoyltransferase
MMRILAMKPGHDGSIAYVEDGQLVFSVEAEKDSFPRFAELSASAVLAAGSMATEPPDVVAIGGWHKDLPDRYTTVAAGYYGLEAVEVSAGRFFGKPVTVFSSSHERSHVFMAACMAPSAPLEECVVLVWEGLIGSLYHWQDYGRRISRRWVLGEPGARYSALFALADETFQVDHGDPRLEDAGKLMALSAFGRDAVVSDEERRTVDSLLAVRHLYPFDKAAYRESPLFNCGLRTDALYRAANYLTDRLFEIFYDSAVEWAPADVPLVISGGCGLNCDWNRRWAESRRFSEVFVPPCANDSGSAIGTAMDAAVQLGHSARLDWSVYSGAPFRTTDHAVPEGWSAHPLDERDLSRRLATGGIVAWVQGRCEIGPRALGHRSLLASPLDVRNRDRLNKIKGREDYRPIAPCCRYEELSRWFKDAMEDPFMLYFNRVGTSELPAVTHVDGTARVQSVRPDQEPVLHRLLTAFSGETGYGVLCNTSLNYRGHGFVNALDDLFAYCDAVGITDAVVDSTWYRKPSAAPGRA